MKKTKIQEILNLSSLTMVDPEYTIFTNNIKLGLYNTARMYIESFIERLEATDDDTTEHLDQIKRCARLEDLVIDLIISNEDVIHDKPKRARRRIVK